MKTQFTRVFGLVCCGIDFVGRDISLALGSGPVCSDFDVCRDNAKLLIPQRAAWQAYA